MDETHKTTNELSGAERQQRSYEARMERVAALIAQGHTLANIAHRRGLPSVTTLRQLCAENAKLREAYDQARDRRNEQLADDAVALADTLADTGPAGLKLRIEARKWRVAIDRKDGKKPPDNAQKKAALREETERLQRALERVKHREDDDLQKIRAQVEAEFAARYGLPPDKPPTAESDDAGFKA
jgi:hypothetical protein